MNIYIKYPDGEMQEFEVLDGSMIVNGRHIFATHGIWGSSIHENQSHNKHANTWLRRIHKQHVFGEQTYEETGERRCAVEAGEPYLSYGCESGMVVCRKEAFTLASPVVILKLISY